MGGDSTALTYQGSSWNYRDLGAAADALGMAMRADRLAGERVALLLPNCVELVTCYLACFSVGAIAAPLNTRYAAPELERALRSAGPRWLVTHASQDALVNAVDESVLRDVRVITVGHGAAAPNSEPYDSLLEQPYPAAGSTPDIAQPPAVIFFTSGSSGRPKGVVHTHRSALAMLTSTSEALGDIRPDDVVQVVEPLVHVSGYIATFATLLAGGTVALDSGFDAQRYVHALTTNRPTLICTHIDVLAQLLRLPGVSRDWFTSLRGVYTGGDTVPAGVHREFRRISGLPIGVGYGMTEAIWLTVQLEPGTEGQGCIGRPVGGARLRVDEQTGELLVAGPMVMQKYWRDEELTAATLADGWLRTGDLGTQDSDGVWWFTGRIKDVIVRRTSKIWPGEVESALNHHPDVAIAAVIGVPDPDEGQVPVAFVVPRSKRSVSVVKLKEFLAQRIAEYKMPARIHLRSALPLTDSGKLKRADLLEDETAH
ncbi:MAG: acyl--CoA ligase [Actinomycetia bacterium]|nr:acyl--CoA ligase [Actinomycetes bacterium]MCH9702448.1 acyl--CoA ligase [Actinomycetes bacterium]MCH9733352.1 acyl--CoA ligase [Actinomycetes bacterium]